MIDEINKKYNLSLKKRTKFDNKYNLNYIGIEDEIINNDLKTLEQRLILEYNKKIKKTNKLINHIKKELDLNIDLLKEKNIIENNDTCKSLYNSCKKLYKNLKKIKNTKKELKSISARIKKIC